MGAGIRNNGYEKGKVSIPLLPPFSPPPPTPPSLKLTTVEDMGILIMNSCHQLDKLGIHITYKFPDQKVFFALIERTHDAIISHLYCVMLPC